MILLAEAGATSISWVLITKGKEYYFNSPGYNPLIADANLLRQMLITSFPDAFSPNDVEQVYYFGTGCGTEYGRLRVHQALNHFFQQCISINVDTDLKAAAIAAYGDKQGIIGILGTGANAGYYNGKDLTHIAPSLGYILGDEGSGAYLGKMILAAMLRDDFDEHVSTLFWDKHNLKKEDAVIQLNKARFPNRFLGSFVPFIKENETNLKIDAMLKLAFQSYFTHYIQPLMAYSNVNRMVIIGGVAFAFKEQLNEVFIEQGIQVEEIYKDPLKLLVRKFQNK